MPATTKTPEWPNLKGMRTTSRRRTGRSLLPKLKVKCQALITLGRRMLARPSRDMRVSAVPSDNDFTNEILACPSRDRRVTAVSSDHNSTGAIIQFESSRENEARHRVFNTPELLDHILSELELNDLLLRASVACLGFKRAIDSSPTINRRLENCVIDAARNTPPCEESSAEIGNIRSMGLHYIGCVGEPRRPSLHVHFDRTSLDRYLASPSFCKIVMPQRDKHCCYYLQENDTYYSYLRTPLCSAVEGKFLIAEDLAHIRERMERPHALKSVFWFLGAEFPALTD